MPEYQKILRNILFDPKQSKESILAAIKSKVPSSEYESAINSNPILKKIKLGKSRFDSINHITLRTPYYFTNDLRNETLWLFYNIKENASFISSFIACKSNFEKQFFLGKYDDAEVMLSNIKSDFGECLWTIEMDMLLKEYKYETQENWGSLSNYLGKIQIPFYQFILNIYSKRIEGNMSFENFFAQFQNEYDSLIADAIVKDFLVFTTLSSVANYDYFYKNLESVLYLANMFGVIDQYFLLIDVFLTITASKPDHDRSILTVLKKIEKLIPNDYRVNNIINVIDPKSDVLILEDTKEILHIIDKYSVGDFSSCLVLCVEKLKDFPHCFELYDIYCKSLINLTVDFQKTNISQTIDDILLLVYNCLLFNKDSEHYRSKILKLSLTFLSFNFGKQLSAFASSVISDSNSNYFELIACNTSSINSPRLLSLNLGVRKQQIYSKFNALAQSSAFRTNSYISGEQLVELEISKDETQASVYSARREFKLGNYTNVIDTIEPFLGNKISPFYYNNILELLFASYLQTNQLLEAMIMSASIVVNKHGAITTLDLRELITRIKNVGYASFSEYIELPVLFSSSVKGYDLYEVYIEFMLSKDEECPSKLDIDSLIGEFSLKKVVFFLKEVCTVDTMQYSLEFSSIDKAETERLEICKLLKNLDKNNAIYYNKEIADVLKRNAVRKAIKEVDAGRLFVNIERLKELQLNSVRESFARFKELELTTKTKGLIGFNATEEKNWINIEFKQKEINQRYNDPAFLALKSIYFETREKFLFSKEYGLDSSLSANFRHGAVKNHIRAVFEKLNLVTSKLGSGYVENSFWTEKLIFNTELNRGIQEKLGEFSKAVDEYTNYIINELIQIQTERHQNKKDGLFDFHTSDSILWEFYEINKERFTSVEVTVNLLYENLTLYTQGTICFEVYNIFTKEINAYYQNLIENLQNDLKNIGLTTQCELLPNILTSSTNIHSELHEIADWFILNTASLTSLLDIETIINASKEYTNSINPTYIITPNITINFPTTAYSSLIYVFNILFTNIIEHSMLSSDSIHVSVTVQRPEANCIEIQIANTISSVVDIQTTMQKLEAVKSNWNNHESIERSNVEGDSGFDKIKRILLYEASCKTDRFEYKVESGEVMISLFLPSRPVLVNIESLITAAVRYNEKIPSLDAVDIIINQKAEGYLASSHVLMAFQDTIKYCLELSKNNIDNSKLRIEIPEPENNYIRVNFVGNVLTDCDLSDSKKILLDVQQNWNSTEKISLSSSDVYEGFNQIKRYLMNSLVKSKLFEYIFEANTLTISLFLLNEQQSNEKNPGN